MIITSVLLMSCKFAGRRPFSTKLFNLCHIRTYRSLLRHPHKVQPIAHEIGTNKIGATYIPKYCLMLDVSIEWFLTNKGIRLGYKVPQSNIHLTSLSVLLICLNPASVYALICFLGNIITKLYATLTQLRCRISSGCYQPPHRVEGTTTRWFQPPHNVACGFPAPRCSGFASQHS